MTTKPRAGRQRYQLKDGTLVPGVTTVLGVISKPALISWANRQGLAGIDTTKYVDSLAAVGTAAHLLIQAHLTKTEPDLSDFTPNQVSLAENALLSFMEWTKGRELETILSETPLVCEDCRFGGTPDWYGLIDGVPTVMDIKTGKGIYDEALYQGAAYAHLLSENGQPGKATVRILQVGRDETEGFSERVVTDYVPYWRVFENALALYQAIRDTKGANHG